MPVPDIAPTGLFMKLDVLLDLLYKMLSIVLSMKTLLFLIASCLGEFESVIDLSFVESRPPPGGLRGMAKLPESPLMPLPTVMPVNCGTWDYRAWFIGWGGPTPYLLAVCKIG